MSKRALIREALQHDDTLWYVVKAYAENIESDARLRKILNDLKSSTQTSVEENRGRPSEKYYERLLDIVQQSLDLLGGEK